MWFATLFSAALLDSLGPWRLAAAFSSGTRGSGNYWRLNRVHQPSLKNLPPTRHHLFSLLHPLSTSLARMLFEPPAIIIKIKCSQSLPTSACNYSLHLLFHRLPGRRRMLLIAECREDTNLLSSHRRGNKQYFSGRGRRKVVADRGY